MNFKPTKSKVWVSIIAGLILGYSFSALGLFQKRGECFPDLSNPGTQLCVDYAFSYGGFLIILIGLSLITYIVWSLVTKKIKPNKLY